MEKLTLPNGGLISTIAHDHIDFAIVLRLDIWVFVCLFDRYWLLQTDNLYVMCLPRTGKYFRDGALLLLGKLLHLTLARRLYYLTWTSLNQKHVLLPGVWIQMTDLGACFVSRHL